MAGRVLRGLAALGLLLAPLALASLYSEPVLVLALFTYGLPGLLALRVADGLYLEHVDPHAMTPTDAGAAAFLAVTAMQTLALAWWAGGGSTWGRRLLRAAAGAGLVYLGLAALLLLLLLEAAAGLGGPGW